MTKMTEREFLNTVTAIIDSTNPVDADQLHEYIINRLEKLDERNANRKPTKKQAANVVLRDEILNAMEIDKRYTVTELTKLDIIAEEGLSVNKISAVMKPYIASEDDPDQPIERVMEKGKALYIRRK